jgi:hypothetical protein
MVYEFLGMPVDRFFLVCGHTVNFYTHFTSLILGILYFATVPIKQKSQDMITKRLEGGGTYATHMM